MQYLTSGVVFFQAKNGETACHLAAASGNLGCLQLLLAHDKGASERRDRYSQTPLHLAVLRCRPRCVKWLLDVGRASPMATTQSGATALHFASALGKLCWKFNSKFSSQNNWQHFAVTLYFM